MPASELLRDRERLAAAVQEAGAVAKKFFRGPLKQWTKGQGDSPVTEADIASNDLLHKHLVEAGDGWLSEESENDPTRLAARRVWVVDPIDGTRAFIAGREDWSVSVALVVDGRPVVAALFAPVTDELFLSTVGGGATRNGVAIRASSGGSLEGARVGGPKRMLDRIVASGTGHCADAAHPFAGAAAGAGRPRRTRRRGGRRQRPRLGPCGCRPFGARSRRHDDRARRPGS